MTQNAYTERVVPFTAGDGMALNLINIRGPQAPSKSPVLLVHGAGVRANIFRAPVERTIIDELIDAGYDVWLENWRASTDLPPSLWTLDQAAVYDHPFAVKKVIEETSAKSIKAIIHCQGSTSFTMSAIAGLVPEVETIISNAVSSHPVVPKISEYKLKLAVPVVSAITDYLNPQWGIEAPTLFAKSLVGFVKLTHRECDNTVCRMISFTYGTGWPTLWLHENLNDETHEWLKHEFKSVPLVFFKQIYQCVKAGHLLAAEKLAPLPQSFIEYPPKTQARFAFFAGEKNVCFLPESQRRAYQYFCDHSDQKHSLHIIPDYGHLDIFMGKNASKDVFPSMLAALEPQAEQHKGECDGHSSSNFSPAKSARAG